MAWHSIVHWARDWWAHACVRDHVATIAPFWLTSRCCWSLLLAPVFYSEHSYVAHAMYLSFSLWFWCTHFCFLLLILRSVFSVCVSCFDCFGAVRICVCARSHVHLMQQQQQQQQPPHHITSINVCKHFRISHVFILYLTS